MVLASLLAAPWLRKLFCLATLLGTLASLAGAAPGQAYPPNFRLVEVPDPRSGLNPTYPLVPKTKPAPGASWTDSRFGTVQARVTQTATLRQEYARFDPFNCDQTLILLLEISSGEYRVYRTNSLPYDQSGNLVRVINNLGEVRWDPADPQSVWGFRDFSIIRLNVITGAETVIKNFATDPVIAPLLAANPYLYRITCKDEGESSRDKRFWALGLQNGADPAQPAWNYLIKYLITWDRQQDQILGTYQLSLAESDNLDWVGMSPLGTWVIIAAASEGGVPPNWGLVMASKDFSLRHLLHSNTGHADVGLDAQGREVIVMQNAQTDFIDLIPLDTSSRPVETEADYTGNLIRPLVRLYYNSASPQGLQSGVHISCNYPGYAVVSTHIAPGTPEQNWLDRCNILVRLDPNNPKAAYLAKLYNTTQQYWEETHATITTDGRRIVWVDNWGQSVPEPQTPQLTLTQLTMPPHWEDQFQSQALSWLLLLLFP